MEALFNSSFPPYLCADIKDLNQILEPFEKMGSSDFETIEIVKDDDSHTYYPVPNKKVKWSKQIIENFKGHKKHQHHIDIACFLINFFKTNFHLVGSQLNILERFRFVINKTNDSTIIQEFQKLYKETSLKYNIEAHTDQNLEKLELKYAQKNIEYNQLVEQFSQVQQNIENLEKQSKEEQTKHYSILKTIEKRKAFIEEKSKAYDNTLVQCFDGEERAPYRVFKKISVTCNPTRLSSMKADNEILKQYKKDNPQNSQYLKYIFRFNHCSLKTFRFFLDFCFDEHQWLEQTSLTSDDLFDLILFADYLGYLPLLRTCVKQIRESLTVENVVSFFNSYPLNQNFPQLLIDTITQFIVLNFSGLITNKTFYQIDYFHLKALMMNKEFYFPFHQQGRLIQKIWEWAKINYPDKGIQSLFEIDKKGEYFINCIPINPSDIASNSEIIDLWTSGKITQYGSGQSLVKPMKNQLKIPVLLKTLKHDEVQIDFTLDFQSAYNIFLITFRHHGLKFKIQLHESCYCVEPKGIWQTQEPLHLKDGSCLPPFNIAVPYSLVKNRWRIGKFSILDQKKSSISIDRMILTYDYSRQDIGLHDYWVDLTLNIQNIPKKSCEKEELKA